jgi:hypothetical protein
MPSCARIHNSPFIPLLFILFGTSALSAQGGYEIRKAILVLDPAPVYLEQPNPPTSDFEVNLKRIFADDRRADIRVIFGYEDYEDFKDPNDPGRADRLLKYLQSHHFTPITPTKELCQELGVRPEASNLRILEGFGSIGQTLRIALMWSSATSSAAKNIGVGYAQQMVCSEDALKFMQKAAEDSEVFFYIGHSRGGGGPDTFPPQTRPGNTENRQQVDFRYYGSEKPGLTSLSPHLGKSKVNPKFVALTGCLSDKHFHQWLTKEMAGNIFPTSVLLSTRLTRSTPWNSNIEGNDEALMALTTFLECLQQHKTEVEFRERLKACEIEGVRNPARHAWKLMALPKVKSSR